ncbi:PREDICTED: gamma-tubulin complex component 5-like isoform X1 [Amphimedon queenslandica]|uniref:Gamma-tubulin complex component n=1 Tax=Amphimedon queenslandica TaxID=400682 RepID=A0AAN0IH46_AMPQE|nr:PREDICTED: gamma-tubulin complex component 5-like isoform X1 [Amphimedon queenslandica]|eukprot:XP_003389114.2 PREDICTED: gamma-tubulin complex component 5-like isoform X1 [Amphimedon queenslandica]
MAALFAKCIHLARQLVEVLTGFTPDEENYQRTTEFVLSNFKYHRFLSVNSNNTKRKLSDLATKFRVHSLPERAEWLEKCVGDFLKLSLFESFSESENHYAILSFLLCLSQSPTSHTSFTISQPDPLPLPPARDGRPFDWGHYLMEGVSFEEYESSSDDSEFIPCSDEDLPLSSHELSHDCKSHDQSHDSAIETSDAEQELPVRLSVCRPYWKPVTLYPSLVNRPSLSIQLTEIQAVRESLWVLLGVRRSCVYFINEGGVVTVRNGITLSHLSLKSLARILETFAELATKLNRFRRVVMVTQSPRGERVCQTQEAFADSLNCYLLSVDETLQKIEKKVSEKREFVSLLNLSNKLNSLNLQVSALTSVDLCSCSTPKSLLDSLWLLLSTYDPIGPVGCDVISVALPLYLMSVCPYISTLDQWMVSGTLHDPMKELFIQSNAESVPGGYNYWRDCYHSTEPPVCFKGISRQLLIAGKSCHLSMSLGSQSVIEMKKSRDNLYLEFLSHFTSSPPEQRLIEPHLPEPPSPEPHPLEPLSFEPPSLEPRPLELHSQSLESSHLDVHVHVPDHIPYKEDGLLVLSNVDPLLREALILLPWKQSKTTNESYELYMRLQGLVPVINALNRPMTEFIEDIINNTFKSRFYESSKLLMEILKDDYQLLAHFSNVKCVLLMSAGDCIHHFTNNLFSKLQACHQISDPIFLNNALSESLQTRQLNERFTVDLSTPLSVTMESLNSINITYDVPWPVNLVFPQGVMSTYNGVFRFLLQMKYARWCLDSVWINIKSSCHSMSPLMHKISLLRAKLLHFMTSINHYLLTRILHSSGLEFEEKVLNCTDMDSLISLHHSYISTIHDRCLLNQKAQIVKEAILKIFSLTLKFYNLTYTLSKFRYEDGQSIEEEFSKCCRFLVSCLMSHIKRGSFPHLETLSFSLTPLLSLNRIFTN